MRAINEMNGYEHGLSLTVRIDQPSQGRKKQGGGGYGASGGRVRSRGVVGNGQGGSNGAQGPNSAKGKKSEQRPRNYAATVFCGNLPWGVTWQQLKDVFAGEGLSPEYADVKIGYDGRSRGWGTVRFADMERRTAANEMNGYMPDGRRLDVHLDRTVGNNRGGRETEMAMITMSNHSMAAAARACELSCSNCRMHIPTPHVAHAHAHAHMHGGTRARAHTHTNTHTHTHLHKKKQEQQPKKTKPNTTTATGKNYQPWVP